MRTMKLLTLLALAAMFAWACGGDEGGSGGGGTQTCTTAADCVEGQTCADTDGDGVKACVAIECEADGDCDDKAADAGVEMICDLGACVPNDDTPPDTDVVDGDTDKDGEEPPPEDVTDDGTQPPVTTGSLCQPCVGDEDCGGGGAICTPLPEGDFCTSACGSNNDCPSGYLCIQITNEAKQCVPGLYNKCPGCLINGCPPGEFCHQSEDACMAVAGECGDCVTDAECGPGGRCFKLGSGVRKCVPECGEGEACPAASSCGTMDGDNGTKDVRVCQPGGTACCFGDTCAVCDCSGEPINQYCGVNGNCVECTNSSHCTDPTHPTCEDEMCVATNCPAERPVPCSIHPSGCCACTNDTHCEEPTPYCDAGTGDCSDIDCDCVAPYPACITVDGQVMCVECANDGHCLAGCTCDLNDYTCMKPDGSLCSSGGGTTAECTGCTGDADCAPVEGLDLKCNVDSGCCFDINGKCDNVAAFCPAGSACTGVMDIVGLDLSALGGGGMGGMIPTDMLGDMPSFCACPPECLTGECKTGQEIADALKAGLGMIGGLLDMLGLNPQGTYCVDPATLGDMFSGILGGLGGGGGIPGFP